ANTFLDTLAHHRHTQNQPATSLAWGLWNQTSTISNQLHDTDLRRLARLGLQPLDTAEALDLFDAALETDEAVLAVTRLDTGALRRQGDAVLPILRGLVPSVPRRASAATGDGSAGGGPALAQRLAMLSETERGRALTDLVRTQVATVLGHGDSTTIDADRAFQELGFDSLTAVELRNQLNQATGLKLPTTLVFDHPNPTALATYLRQQISVEEASAADPVLAELGRLEAAVRDASADAEAYDLITTRLRDLLDVAETASGARQAAEGADAADDDLDDDLDDASDEELFALINGLD
ncbi:beta-ketoacyl reductase, partial [Streptomyces boluensis]|uniref:beta-ketoacyl reductase n=1 Tax=Streptomyces boluensis TaxID=1775135 RepID=UPI0016524E92